jgi:hypothetical protein
MGQGVPSLLAFAQIPRQNVTNYVFLLIDSRRSSDRVTAGSESGRSWRLCCCGWFLMSEMDARILSGSPICQGRRTLLLATWSLFCTHKSAKCSSTARCCTGSKQPVWTGSGDTGKLDGIRQEVGPGAVNSEVRGPFGFRQWWNRTFPGCLLPRSRLMSISSSKRMFLSRVSAPTRNPAMEGDSAWPGFPTETRPRPWPRRMGQELRMGADRRERRSGVSRAGRLRGLLAPGPELGSRVF